MSNIIILPPSVEVVARAPASSLLPSSSLQDVVGQIINPHPDIPLPRSRFPALAGEAAEALAALRSRLEPASEDAIRAWLWPVANAVEYTPTEDEFQRRLSALLLVSDDVPGCAWSLQAQRMGLIEWRQRLPSVGSIVELVNGPVRKLISQARALRLIASTQSGITALR